MTPDTGQINAFLVSVASASNEMFSANAKFGLRSFQAAKSSISIQWPLQCVHVCERN
ncbi:hypothetical protein N9V89_01000 [Pseudoalteromonas sp.]|nr:hypothetical protein [Pseudoalteromonas sp.]